MEPNANGVIQLQPPTGKRPLVRILDRVETVDLTEDGYAGATITICVNPPDAMVTAWFKDEKNQGEVLADIIKGWNLADAAGAPLPVTFETISQLPSDIIAIVNQEFWRRRDAPLAKRRAAAQSTTSKASAASSTPPTPSSSTPSD